MDALDGGGDPLGWSVPELVPGLGNMSWSSPTLNPDASEMFLESATNAIFRSTWNGQTWTPPVIAMGVEAPPGRLNMSPHLTRDGRTLYFGSDRDTLVGAPDVFRVTRVNATDPTFTSGTLEPVAALNTTTTNDNGGSVTTDDELLLFTSDRNGRAAIYQSRATGAGWGRPST